MDADEETVIAGREEELVYQWRLNYLLGLGFPDVPAVQLALSAADCHEVQAATVAGCDHETAARLFA